MTKYIIAGNWKMNKTPDDAAVLAKDIVNAVANAPAEAEVVICPPFTALSAVAKIIAGSSVALGAQNMHFEKSGAYTGEVAPDMLVQLGVKYVIIGHSERRAYFAETDETVNKKVIAAFANGLVPIICVGETLHERELGITADLVRMQVRIAFGGITAEQAKTAVIAYEPVWAIGTGKTATNEQADEVCGIIRQTVGEIYNKDVAAETVIQYGGSMNAANARELLSMPNINGGLIGGASLKSEDFKTIVFSV